MILQEAPDQSIELATSITQALNGDKKQALAALFHDKISKAKLKQLMAALDEKRTVGFDLIEMHGKIKIPRYEVIIDFTSNEVHVIMKNNKHEYGAHEFKVLK